MPDLLDVPGWGTEVVEEAIAGRPHRVYADRHRHLVDLLDDGLVWGDREYLVHGDRRVSFLEHRSLVEGAAAGLAGHGVAPGARVMLLGDNSIEWVVAFWAVALLDAVVVSANSWWSPDEVASAVRLVDPALVLTDERHRSNVPAGVPVLDLRQLLEPRPATGSRAPAPRAPEDAPALILFTSGTTGAAKGAVLTHRSVIANVQNLVARQRRRAPGGAAAGRQLYTAPLFHQGGIQALTCGYALGTTLILQQGRFDAGEVLRLIERERVTLWTAIPTAVARVVDHPAVADHDLSSVAAVSMGGAPVPAAVTERAREVFPNARTRVGSGYGASEAGGVVASATGPELLARPGTVGRALPTVEVRIDGPPGQPGEILVRSPAVMVGYWGQPEDRTVDADGWLHTGDLGRLDRDGYLYIVGRAKDVIIRGGENVASAHVEDHLLRHPGVREAAVVPMPHDDLGEEVGAVVVSDGDVDGEELRAFLTGRLASFEVPTRWWVRRQALPTNATGKIDKRRLQADWLQRAMSTRGDERS